MTWLQVPAPAKINWALAIDGCREDGYHLLRTIMQKIDLADDVYIRLDAVDFCQMNAGISLASADNIALKAWWALKKKYGLPGGLSIRIDKRIPAGAGLAGGSADAAAVLLGVNQLFALALTPEELTETAVTLGADVPFCLSQHSAALAEGIGEKLTPISVRQSWLLLLVKPQVSVNTKEAFALYDTLPPTQQPDIERLALELSRGKAADMVCHMGNALEPAACLLAPEILHIKQTLEAAGLNAFMSGSGSSVVGWAEDSQRVEAAAASLRQTSWWVQLTHTLAT